MMEKFKHLILMFLILLLTFPMFGQDATTSSMNGKIVDTKGIPLPGATIVATHVPSGAIYGATANTQGMFSIQGMRPGGPYKIEVSFVGFGKKTFTEITLNLGEIFVLNSTLEESTSTIGEVVVVGSKVPTFNSEKNGASINIDNRTMVAMPTISRSINDITRLTPQANGNQIGGGNYRQNFILVDGAQFNNAFGIGSNLPGSGSPISLDALDQISVNITPYDVRQSGFIGASINAVTRSGSNEFSGSVYTYMQDERFKGNNVSGVKFTKTPSSYLMVGARLGGPIIKNRLFFFLNYETEKTKVPGPPRVASTATTPPDYPNQIARPTDTKLDSISQYLSTKYGYETGPYQGYSNESPGTKFLARIDWNISKNHKFNIRYSMQKRKDPNYPSTSVSPFSSIYTGNRQSMDAMWFQNSGYYQESNFSSVASELNSSFLGGKIRNVLRGTYSYQDEPRSTTGKLFPFVDILKNGSPYVSFGTELFSYGNLRQVKTITVNDDFSFSLGINNFTLGVNYESNDTKNGFMRFGSSFYVFNSWDDFTNGVKPVDFGITFSNTPGYAQAFPSFKFYQYSAYIQDEISIGSRLKVVAGLRADRPEYPSPAPNHPIIDTLKFNGVRYHTSTMPKSTIMWSPRIGFNFDILGDHKYVLRGGTGIFTGRVPFVWIVSQVGDAGMLQTTLTYAGQANTPGPFDPNINAYYPAVQPAAGTIVPSTFTMISDNFRMPQSWKSSMGLDAKLPWGLKGTAEFIYNKDINTAFFVNRGLKSYARLAVNGYPDNRMIYPSSNSAKYFYLQTGGKIIPTGSAGVAPIVLENRDGGYYWSLTGKLEKTFSKGFYGMIAYTHSDARNLVDGGGDQAASAWNGNANVNGANSAELSYPSYVIPDKIIANFSYRIEYMKFMASSISLVYEGGSNGRFSYTYSSNIARDGAGSNNLIFVPRDASDITFVNQTLPNGQVWTAQEQSDAFFKYIAQDKYLSSRVGQYAERNGVLQPWVHRFDLKLQHEFFINVAGKRNTLQISLDILNVGNLINNHWGVLPFFNQNQILVMTNASSLVAGGTVRPTFRLNPWNNDMITHTYSNNLGYGSTYAMQLGIRYTFN
jgi:hypothetical protein